MRQRQFRKLSVTLPLTILSFILIAVLFICLREQGLVRDAEIESLLHQKEEQMQILQGMLARSLRRDPLEIRYDISQFQSDQTLKQLFVLDPRGMIISSLNAE